MLPKIPKHRRTPGSSNVQGHSYDPTTGNLDVTFKGNRTYRYSGVPVEKAASFRDSKSQGSFVHAELKDKHDSTEMKPKR